MVQLVPIILAALLVQDPKKPPPPSDDEEVVRGLPDGDIVPLPERIEWDLKTATSAKTSMRERTNLGGLWRFAAVLEKESPVARSEMGWIEMPELWSTEGVKVLDARLRGTDGLWRGRPLDKFPFAWVERDLVIRNDDALKWLKHRVFLVLRGPWSDAEVYVSQRMKNPALPGAKPDDQPAVYVHVEQVTGVDHDDGRWFEITEQLAYPGSNQISLRLRAPRPNDSDAAKSPSYVGVEMLPLGPRVESVRLVRDPARGEIEATIHLVRPFAFTIVRGPPVKSIPMTLRLRLDDVEKDATLQKLDQEIGPIVDESRRVVMRLPWSAGPGKSPPRQARLRLRLDATGGGIFDEIHPIEFKPAELPPTD